MDTRAPDDNPLYCLHLSAESDGAGNSDDEVDQLQLERVSCWDFQFRLDDVPPPLATAVYQMLQLLAYGVGEALLPSDLREIDWMLEEMLNLYEELNEQGIVDDPERVLAYLNANGANVWGITRAEDAADLLEWLRRLAEPLPPWAQPLQERNVAAEAERLLRLAWAWRREQRDLYRHPWGRFLRRAAGCIRRLYRRWNPADRETLLLAGEEMDLPLSYACFIGLGLSWEQEALETLRHSLAEAGEEPRARLRLTREHLPLLRGYLEALATAQGLLVRAEVIDLHLRSNRDNG